MDFEQLIEKIKAEIIKNGDFTPLQKQYTAEDLAAEDPSFAAIAKEIDTAYNDDIIIRNLEYLKSEVEDAIRIAKAVMNQR